MLSPYESKGSVARVSIIVCIIKYFPRSLRPSFFLIIFMMKELTCGELVSSYKELVFRANLLDPYSKEDMNLQKKVRVIIHEAISFQ